MSVTITTRFGIALILAPLGWYGAWRFWDQNRTWRPVDMPVSVAPGHIRTRDFKINVRSRYRIALRTSDVVDTNFSATWSVWKSGTFVASGAGHPYPSTTGFGTETSWVFGDFDADDGTYVVDVSIVESDSRLNPFRPRLAVFEDDGRQDESRSQGSWSILAILLLFPNGIRMIALGRNSRKRADLAISAALPRIKRCPARWSFQKPGWFGIIGVNLVISVLLILMGIEAIFAQVSKGLEVTPMGKIVKIQPSAGIQPLLLHIISTGVYTGAYAGVQGHPDIELNWKPVAREDLAAVLRYELARRPQEWPVYVQGDAELAWGDVAPSIEIIQTLGAKAVLTPVQKH